jgi:hypothetical protein
MLEKMNEIFGSGEEGTVAYNVFDEGNRRRPKGIPQLTLMASLLDPRMKAGIGIPPMDKGHLWRMIKDEAVRIAREDLVLGQQQQQQHDGGGEPQQQRPNPNQPIYITCLRKLIIITCLSSSITMKMLEETMMIITMQRWWRDSIRNI